MVLNDYLSRQHLMSLKPCQNETQDTFMVHTRPQAKGVKPPTKRKTIDSTCKKVQIIKPIILEDEDDDDQDIFNQMGAKSSTSRDTKSTIKEHNVPNQIYPQPTVKFHP